MLPSLTTFAGTKDEVGPDRRTVTVHVSVPERPMEVRVRLASDNTVRSARVFDQKVAGGGKDWSMTFRGFPAEGADITFQVDSKAPLALKLEARLLGLPSLPGIPARPDYMAVEPNTIQRPWSFRGDEVFLIRTVNCLAAAKAPAPRTVK